MQADENDGGQEKIQTRVSVVKERIARRESGRPLYRITTTNARAQLSSGLAGRFALAGCVAVWISLSFRIETAV
jgi:hypothetical protein